MLAVVVMVPDIVVCVKDTLPVASGRFPAETSGSRMGKFGHFLTFT
jgi:hypothetical protein